MFEAIGRSTGFKRLPEERRVFAYTVALYLTAFSALVFIGQQVDRSAQTGDNEEGGMGFMMDRAISVAFGQTLAPPEMHIERSPARKRQIPSKPKVRDSLYKMKLEVALPSVSDLLTQRSASLPNEFQPDASLESSSVAATEDFFTNTSSSSPGAGSGVGVGNGSGTGNGSGSGNGVGRSGTSWFKHIPYGDVVRTVTVQPDYPQAARKRRIEGLVLVQVTCSASGDVIDVQWLSGPEIFREEVLKAAWRMKYRPEIIPFRFTQPFEFRLY